MMNQLGYVHVLCSGPILLLERKAHYATKFYIFILLEKVLKK